ncbi:MAG: hypothetical protein Q4B64_01655 [Spirochaetales bacterium]|nr:hypothetical protein [Spirochaetales bacterium]
MKTNKEFPATHSMSTSWFVADEEGNIALFDFDDNGPVPNNIPSENYSTLMTAENDFGEKDNDFVEYFELTDEQIEELMSDSHSPEKADIEDPYDYFVQVDEENKKEFFEVFYDDIQFCFSHKHGIYFMSPMSVCGAPEFYVERAKRTFIKTVTRVAFMPIDSYIWEDFVDSNSKWKLPFYCYKQPYSSYTDLAKRTNVPKYPFKESQISEKQRNKLIRVPLKFSECTGFQIAQYVICNWHGGYDDIELNKKEYTKFPKTEGGFGYFLRHQIPEKDGDKPIIIDAKD